jgi:hypothetical protein
MDIGVVTTAYALGKKTINITVTIIDTTSIARNIQKNLVIISG